MTDDYVAIRQAVAAAGFFSTGVEDKGSWDRITICSQSSAEGTLCGNSFWVARLPNEWYLGVWGGFVYRLRDESRLAELCIDWLSRAPRGTGRTQSDFDDVLKEEFGLLAVSHEDFDLAAGCDE